MWIRVHKPRRPLFRRLVIGQQQVQKEISSWGKKRSQVAPSVYIPSTSAGHNIKIFLQRKDSGNLQFIWDEYFYF